MRYISIIVLILFSVLALPLPVMAIADPDTPPTVNGVYVYEDLLEDGDVGVLVDYYLDYAVTPNETANEAFLAIFIDTDGTTQLKAIAPYVYVTSGYGRGVMWIYFSASEVTTYGIDRANQALYTVWLMGNPTLGWSGAPPKTIGSIDYWQPDGSSSSTLLGLRVLAEADILELAWGISLIDETPLGSRLSTLGESYFVNVIPNLVLMAPQVFSSSEYNPTLEDIDYTTVFGATMTNLTGICVGSPIDLAEGANTVNVTTAGTFTLELNKGVVGTATSGTATVAGSPVDLVYGTNTVNVTTIGLITIDVELEDTESGLTDLVTGTGFDLTAIATIFGMSRWMFSGIIWVIMSIIVCVFYYGRTGNAYGASGKNTLLIFDICIIGGTVLGLVHPIVGILLFIGFSAFTGYILFFRQANV